MFEDANMLNLKVAHTLGQACQTQITVRAAHWVVNLEKLTAGRSLELHMTLCVNFKTYFSQFYRKMDKN